MKKWLLGVACLFTAATIAGPAHADRDHDRGHYERGGDHDRRGSHDQRSQHRGDYDRDRGYDYDRYHGYRDRPYGDERHYDHYRYRDHDYGYRGHWRSWDAWNDYARHHPGIREHGHYYREHGHLMFRFCDPASGGCFYFSIGG